MIEATTTPTAEFIESLLDLDNAIKKEANKHDRVRVLVCACVGEGIDAGGLIVSTLAELGFDKRHVGALLTKELKAGKAWLQCLSN